MVTYFNRKDLVSFGTYLMSEKRKARFAATNINVPLEDRMKVVHQEDVVNWIESKRKKKDAKEAL